MPFLRSHPDVLDAFRRGDVGAMAKVYWAYVARIEAYLRRYTRAIEVADLVQEVFLRAFVESRRRAYDAARDYAPYLVTIARNLLFDAARRAGREVATDSDAFREIPAEEEPAEAWADPATVAIVETYLTTLSAELRAVHDVRYVRGLPQREAAEAIGISRQQLRTREAHLREGLAAALREAEGG